MIDVGLLLQTTGMFLPVTFIFCALAVAAMRGGRA